MRLVVLTLVVAGTPAIAAGMLGSGFRWRIAGDYALTATTADWSGSRRANHAQTAGTCGDSQVLAQRQQRGRRER